MRSGLGAAGFVEASFQDVTSQGLEAIRAVAARPSWRGFGLGTLMGPEFPGMAANLAANLQSGACRLAQAVFLKPLRS
jgi:hypothetical protein